MAYRLTELSIITDRIASVLKEAGIADSEELLLAVTGPGGVKALAEQTGIDARLIGEIAERADIMRVRGIGPAYVELLEHAGVRALTDVAASSSDDLYARISKAAETYGITRIPRTDEVAAWIENAKADLDVQTWANGIRTGETQAIFADDEWTKIRLAPVAVAALVMTASTSWGEDWSAEERAAATVIENAKKGTLPYSLVNVAYPKGLDVADLQKFIETTPRAAMMSTVKTAADLVAAKAPGAAQSYRALLMEVGEAVAAAAKEGGFLGMGKKVVSKEEQATLDDIKATIG